jgi:TctA family transporter
MLDAFQLAGGYLLNPDFWIAFVIAVSLAGLSGLVPGLGAPIVMAMALPFVIFTIKDPIIGLILLSMICGANNTLDSIPAVLVGIPGSATQVTYLEGHQLARRGKAAHTLGAIYAVSAIGGMVGALCLLIAMPLIRPFILAFSFGEIAATAMVGLAFISVLGQGARLKGLAAAFFGLLLGTVGIAPGTGAERFVFGELFLWGGIPTIAFVIGVLALPELADLLVSRKPVASRGADVSFGEVMRGFRYGLTRWKMTIRQSLLGTWLGAVPGVGAPIIDWMAYSFGILFSKDRSQFGKGSLEGVLFTESAQNAKEGGQAIPTLALGIPGGLPWAIVITAMYAYQVAPGPQMLDQYAHLTILLVFSLALANLGLTILALGMTPALARMTLLPYPAVAAIAIPLVILASYLETSDWRGVLITVLFAIMALVMKRFSWPRPPFLIAFILGPIIEENLLNALSVQGGLLPVLMRPVTFVLLLLVLATVLVFHFVMKRTAATAPNAAEGVPVTPSLFRRPTAWIGEMHKFRFGWEQIAPICLILTAAVFLWDSQNLAQKAAVFPQWLCAGLILLAGLEFFRSGLLSKQIQGQIFDLGLLSSGTEGARRTTFIVIGLVLAFFGIAVIFGLPYGAIAFAVLCPITLLDKHRLLTAAVAGIVIAFFAFYFIEEIMGVVWPWSLLTL